MSAHAFDWPSFIVLATQAFKRPPIRIRRSRFNALVFAFCTAIAAPAAMAASPASQPSNVFDLYAQAQASIHAISPSDSNLDYPNDPPFGPEWDTLSDAAWKADETTRKLIHQARSIDQATLPTTVAAAQEMMNKCRSLANNIGDAALYQHFHGNDSGAIESIEDLLHMSSLIRASPGPIESHLPLVAGGIDALLSYRALIIASDLHLNAQANISTVSTTAAVQELIQHLLALPDPTVEVALYAKGKPDPSDPNIARGRETFERCNAIRICAAISLACHLYFNEVHQWPKSLNDLLPKYLPSVPIDYWGDGKQPFGYIIIKAGAPPGMISAVDRPLVYDRSESRDGLFYLVDHPHYSFYVGDGSNLPRDEQKHGGQFYDITSWTPSKNSDDEATTQPLPADATH